MCIYVCVCVCVCVCHPTIQVTSPLIIVSLDTTQSVDKTHVGLQRQKGNPTDKSLRSYVYVTFKSLKGGPCFGSPFSDPPLGDGEYITMRYQVSGIRYQVLGVRLGFNRQRGGGQTKTKTVSNRSEPKHLHKKKPSGVSRP